MSGPRGPVLVVAGEASGDRAAAPVIRCLESRPAFGFGGDALRAEGVELVGDLKKTTALGLTEPLFRLKKLVAVYKELVARARSERPRAALLVNYTEFNLRLAADLRPLGVRIVWYGAPQIWAWRKGRAKTLRGVVDRLCVLLPFEEPLWQAAGVDATYVGHPALETPLRTRAEARTVLGLTERAATVAILPGSREHEVRGLLPAMIEGYERVRRDRASVDARLFLAPSLDVVTATWAEKLARAVDLEIVRVDASTGIGALLPAFDAALTASGTASLECAIAGAVPVVAYKVSLVTELGARLLLDTPHVALPNVLLERRAFDEILQREVTPQNLARALARALDDDGKGKNACREVVRTLGVGKTPSRTVARILETWLDP
jgi:lipid-A-disaccharide synthase